MRLACVLFDFHNTLVMTGSMEGWLKQAASDVNETVDVANVLPVLSTVWARAGARHRGAAWDLDPVVHRIAFEEVLSEESSCSPSLARRLYDLMPEQWVASPGAVELLAAMKRRGVAVGLLSNTALDPRRRLAELGLLEHLDAVVLSEGMQQPVPTLGTMSQLPPGRSSIGSGSEATRGPSAAAPVLQGDGSYDALAEPEQAIVRAAWDERCEVVIAALNFEQELVDQGASWAESDDAGDLLIRGGE